MAAAASRASAFFDRLGVTAAEGNVPIELRYDPTVKDAAYKAKLGIVDGKPQLSDEHVDVGKDPFTGKPFSDAPDVLYHELSHHVVSHIVPGLGMSAGSKIVDESLADTFAAAIDGNWTMGEGLVGGSGLRSMQDPSSQLMLDGSNRVVVPTPSKVGDVTEATMQKGAYFNMGPLNHAAYLIGTSQGSDTMARIYLQAVRKHLGPESSMTDLVVGTIRGAGELYGSGSTQQASVRDAWKAVGMRAAAVDATH